MEKFCDLIKGDKPVFVIFYATWCPHCRKMLPIVSQLGKHKELIFLKYDIDDPANKRLVDYYQIQAVPLHSACSAIASLSRTSASSSTASPRAITFFKLQRKIPVILPLDTTSLKC